MNYTEEQKQKFIESDRKCAIKAGCTQEQADRIAQKTADSLYPEAVTERVAIAICNQANYSYSAEQRALEYASHKPYYLDQAKAAMKAMEAPTHQARGKDE